MLGIYLFSLSSNTISIINELTPIRKWVRRRNDYNRSDANVLLCRIAEQLPTRRNYNGLYYTGLSIQVFWVKLLSRGIEQNAAGAATGIVQRGPSARKNGKSDQNETIRYRIVCFL